MTAAELLINALDRSHNRKIAACDVVNDIFLAGDLACERSSLHTALRSIENQLGAGPRAAFEAAVFALAGVDP